MGGKNKGGSEAAQARADEQERQARIRAGTQRINSIFDGSKTAANQFGADTVYDPTKTYYKADGTAFAPSARATMPGQTGEGTKSGDMPLTAEEEFRQALGGGLYGEVKSGGTGFNDDFFKERRQAFIDYATPQLDDQFAGANKELTYSLARSGLLDSSVRADKAAELQKKYDLNKQQIGDQALSYESEARTNVEKARADLVAMLNATGDAEGAANSALARSQALSAPQAFSPLTQLFGDFTAGLGTQAAIEKANASASAFGLPTSGRYNTGLFSNNKSVVASK